MTYNDDQVNFCLNDGEMLTPMGQPTRYADDAPPTVLLDKSRVTNPTDWPSTPPPSPIGQWQSANPPMPQFGQYVLPFSPNQTLAAVSLGLGITSLVIGWCCSSGLMLGPAALVTGFIALSQIKKDPAKYGGRGMAIGGIATGAVFLSIYVLILLIYGLAVIGGGLFH